VPIRAIQLNRIDVFVMDSKEKVGESIVAGSVLTTCPTVLSSEYSLQPFGLFALTFT